MVELTDDDRRRRLAVRHGLAHRLDTVEAATRAMTVLHATEAATVHLALWARVDGVTVADVDRALYDDRSVVKQLAMRRTLFAFPRELLPAAWGSAARRVAGQQRALMVKDLVAGGVADTDAWLARAEADVLALLADGTARTTAEVREQVSSLAGTVQRGTPGSRWAAEVPLAPRVMSLLGAEGRIVRAANAGHWRLNKPAWTTTEAWLGDAPSPLPEPDGYAELVRRWLATFGPGTEADIVWWLGATKSAVRRALADLDAVQVGLEGGGAGWVLPDDTAPVTDEEADVRPWAALLPTLDPTVMGWKERSFYLDAADTPYLFDSNGNAGNTAWWDGRVVGCWVQDDAARVHLVLRDDVPAAGRKALEAEAERLTSWLDGVRITNVYASPQMRGARLP
ncbi:hypothetical protein BJ993_000618 [Nocardioides aromaticivorans]|uniref:Winged helix DNA-binding domain-containing protein n=1 Tax=Nocardioides aromaticivorans TaxID=200618 RepID=A0A7Y9ZFX7_9ACTN|nr:winged helix DNA-binding domain-containing protein [Nocardioides aromaticivorans]NYI43538.1 hypothetical protein [Nocardioides aromaticivorans]